MTMLTPVTLAEQLRGALEQLLSYLWSSLMFLCFRFKYIFCLPGAESGQQAIGRRKEDSGEAEGQLTEPIIPTSVNYHFTRQCNYKCGFCFHTAKTSFVLPLDEAKRGLLMLKEAGEFLSRGKYEAQPRSLEVGSGNS